MNDDQLRDAAEKALAEMEARKDAAYLERNQCVALIARMAIALGWKAGIARTAIEGWSDDWHGCVYIDLPAGQVSWHFHDSQASLFDGLPHYAGAWDGHDTPEKYRRVGTTLAAPSERQEATERHSACKPDTLVNGGALKLALNVLRRAGKNEVADELEATVEQPRQEAAAAAKVGQALHTLRGVMAEDRSYAWAWHCNIAMAMMDAMGENKPANAHRICNDGAARFMERLMLIDVREFPEWKSHELEWAEEAAAASDGVASLAYQIESTMTLEQGCASEFHGHILVVPVASIQAVLPGGSKEAAAAGQGERAAFEAWAKAYGRIFLDRKGDGYEFSFTQEAWVAWQARASLPASPSQWQPIETAPKDGRTLLLGRFNVFGKWRTMRGQWMSDDYISEYWEDPDGVEDGWFETAVEPDDVPNCWPIDPTHWMPLPAAPSHPAQGDA